MLHCECDTYLDAKRKGATGSYPGSVSRRHGLDPQDDLFCEGQAGMNGVAVDPEFDDNRFIYVFSASSLTEPGTNRVLRLTVNDDLSEVADRTDIIEDILYKPEATDQPFGGPGAQNGGRIRFVPEDRHLYVTTGDTHNAEVLQSPTLLGGKV